MSGKASIAVFAIAAILCGLAITCDGHNMTHEKLDKWIVVVNNAKCNVTFDKDEETKIYKDCIYNLTQKTVKNPEDLRSYINFNLTSEQRENVTDCAYAAHNMPVVWNKQTTDEFINNNMTFLGDTKQNFTKEIDKCHEKIKGNSKEFLDCGKKAFFKVCLNLSEDDAKALE